MKIVKINDKETLNSFLLSKGKAPFLESWEWGEFQNKAGHKAIRLGAEDDGKIVACATIIKKKLFLGKSYFYCPRGPVFGAGKEVKAVQELLYGEIKKIALEEKAIFLRFEPITELKDESRKLKVEKTIDVQPSKTIVLDLDKGEDELLKEMHQKTRYNIRLAEKKKVKILEMGIENFDCFWRLANETKDRDNFRLHSKNYYCQMIECACQPGGNYNQGNANLVIKLFMAEYDGKIIASNLVSFFGDTVTYMHGASSNGSRNVMAPYLLQWHCIKLAKSLGYRYYDFYGTDENKWPGVTRFKRGFGGEEIDYPGTFDLAFDDRWYGIYKTVRSIRRFL